LKESDNEKTYKEMMSICSNTRKR